MLEPHSFWAGNFSVNGCNPEDHTETWNWVGNDGSDWVVSWGGLSEAFDVAKLIVTALSVLAVIINNYLQLVKAEISNGGIIVGVECHPLRTGDKSYNKLAY